MSQYKDIPVAVARDIAEKFDKSLVVIVAFDTVYQKTHTTTYGKSPREKVWAADAGYRCAKAVGGLPELGTNFEDFRYRTQAEWAAEKEQLTKDRDNWLNERNQLLKLTESLDEHPAAYDGPCACKACQSYADSEEEDAYEE